jgi:hypothetical protein
MAKENFLTEMPKREGPLVCIVCGFAAATLYKIDYLYHCFSCADAKQRKERWESEEELWKENNLKTE